MSGLYIVGHRQASYLLLNFSIENTRFTLTKELQKIGRLTFESTNYGVHVCGEALNAEHALELTLYTTILKPWSI